MKIPSWRSLLLLAAALAGSGSALAQTNFTIEGEIVDEVCTPTVIGINGGLLTLPQKTLSQMNASDPSIPGSTVRFDLINCDISASITHVWVHFTATDMTDGRINTDKSQVAFQLRDIDAGVLGGQVDVGGSAAATGPGSGQGTAAAFTGVAPNRNASKSYAVHYYRKISPVTQTGAVTGQATYTIQYY